MEASHLDCLKRICVALDQMHSQIVPDLTPEQLEKLKQVENDPDVQPGIVKPEAVAAGE